MTEYAHNWDYQAPAPVVPVPVETEPSVEEHAQMIQKAFGKVLDKAMQHTDLSNRVKDLEDKLASLGQEIASLRSQLRDAQVVNDNLGLELSNVQNALAHRESTIHDLVQERDIVLGERNNAQAERDSARRESNDWETKYNEAQRTIDGLNGQITQLTARNEELTQKMEAFRNAFRGLAT